MKKAVLISILVLGACTPTLAHAKGAYNILLAGGAEESMIAIGVSPDGRSYVIDSVAPLEVGGSICVHPPENANQLVCEASAVKSFEVNAGSGNDSVVLGRAVPVPATLRGGPGDDRLLGGAGNDMLIGGAGDDTLVGRGGADALFGSAGNDTLIGCSGDDTLRGDGGNDVLKGGLGVNDLQQ